MDLPGKLANLEVQAVKQFIPVEDVGSSLEQADALDLVPYRAGMLARVSAGAQAESALLVFSHFEHLAAQGLASISGEVGTNDRHTT